MSYETPARSLEQRMEALERANRIRSARKALKGELKDRRLSGRGVLLAPPAEATSMRVVDLLLATPKIGRVKANRMMVRARVSPSRTLDGLTDRQRIELAALMP